MVFRDGSQYMLDAVLFSEFAGETTVIQQLGTGNGYLYVVVFFQSAEDAAKWSIIKAI